MFAAGSIDFSMGSDSVNEGNQMIDVCLNLIINANGPGNFVDIMVTSNDGTAQLGKYVSPD